MSAKLDIEKFFLVPHFMVIATYPGMKEKIGDLIHPSTHEYAESYLAHPAIFEKREWWQDRCLPTFLEIEYIEVIKPGYYRTGDKLSVKYYDFEGLETRCPRIVGFAASYQNRTVHHYKLNECQPATEEKLLP